MLAGYPVQRIFVRSFALALFALLRGSLRLSMSSATARRIPLRSWDKIEKFELEQTEPEFLRISPIRVRLRQGAFE